MIKGQENYDTAVKGFIAAIVLFVLTACAFWCGIVSAGVVLRG